MPGTSTGLSMLYCLCPALLRFHRRLKSALGAFGQHVPAGPLRLPVPEGLLGGTPLAPISIGEWLVELLCSKYQAEHSWNRG